MVHGILQFTPSIAFRYVLHRCKSRDIRCRESFRFVSCRFRRTPSFGVDQECVSDPWHVWCRGLGFAWRGEVRCDRPSPDASGVWTRSLVGLV
ncbi:hypothetical protein VIGAN_UM164100 [Vigna angularis var. angularis]|uniref:Uncharacterized protein n=1 Tax=Vigna angularis var. angularis TaxID=157739 RepID=A0A0S3TEW1_PHAAN|nr:hypothetical protein VIGAN_UM145700 [Vigna angularis var. angularis]BAU03717.1 hypothetical protein VIGAN_UM164100 [Vigna angularis var. angularis]